MKEPLDDVVLGFLKTGRMTNADLRQRLGLGRDYSADLDRTLQRLRRAGEIVSTTKGWELSGTVVCPVCKGEGRVRG